MCICTPVCVTERKREREREREGQKGRERISHVDVYVCVYPYLIAHLTTTHSCNS